MASNNALRSSLVEETRWLNSLSEEQRRAYVNSIIENLIRSVRKIIAEPNPLEQLKLAQLLLEEARSKAQTLIPPIMYMIKPEFQPTFIKILDEFSAL